MIYIIGLNLINIMFEIELKIHNYIRAKKIYYKIMT